MSYAVLEKLGRERLSPNFFFRDFLYSEIANYYRMSNLPHFPDIAIEAARGLCVNLLEPLTAAFGKISIRSAYRSPEVNELGNSKGLNCASNASNYSGHIYDYRDSDGALGATATIVINSYVDQFESTGDWRSMAWFIHDHLPYSSQYYFPKLCALNLTWSENPKRTIDSYVQPKGTLTKPGMANHDSSHADAYDTPYFHTALKNLKAFLTE
ncbi:MAG: hypothetical protein HLUCCA04_12535 [Oceanicaulis sp. HLUCCA04]|nr:MAG: hypothetical protein HLUCCA04_12535 [Oceanicaulis sp. HLUCCA04]